MSSIGFSAFTVSNTACGDRASDNCLDSLSIIPIIFNLRAHKIGGREGERGFRVSVRIDKYEPAKGADARFHRVIRARHKEGSESTNEDGRAPTRRTVSVHASQDVMPFDAMTKAACTIASVPMQ